MALESIQKNVFFLVADIGGTKANIELYELTIENEVRLHKSWRTKTTAHVSVLALLTAFLALKEVQSHQDKIMLGAVAVCGPVCDGRASLLGPSFGSSGWVVCQAELSCTCGFEVHSLCPKLFSDSN